MTDRELLERAAKAYVDKSWHNNPAYMEGFLSSWNPLEDDGSAFRLAIQLGISIDISNMFVHADCRNSNTQLDIGYCEENSARNGGCMRKATRLAIVRAAALIGESL